MGRYTRRHGHIRFHHWEQFGKVDIPQSAFIAAL
jgi:hypothetical protein